jgi:hypothetical protein
MKRIGYDADTQRYTFRSATGELYHSEPGSRYGPLTPVAQDDDDSLSEDADERTLVEKDNREAVGKMLPFALPVLVSTVQAARVDVG